MGIYLANAGTPLMWAGLFHLLFGNLLIGIVEAWIIMATFRLKRKLLLTFLMITANYASAWAGYHGLWAFSDSHQQWLVGDIPLLNLQKAFWTLVAIAFAMSLAIEWPFCFVAIRSDRHRVARATVAVIMANAASYVLLLGWYDAASRNTLDQVQIESNLGGISLPEYSVFYISPTDGDVYRLRLDNSAPQRVFTAGEHSLDSALDVRPTSSPDLQNVIIDPFDQSLPKRILGPAMGMRGQRRYEDGESRWWNFHFCDEFRSQSSPHAWEFGNGYWAAEGLCAYRANQDDPELNLAVEIPFFPWRTAYPTALPGDFVVLEFGPQIVLLDPSNKTLHFLALGRSPLVLKDPIPSTQPAPASEPHSVR